MIVRELIEKLQELDPGMRVLVSCDEEGNKIDTLWTVGHEKILAGDPEMNPLNQDDIRNGEYGDNPEIEEVVVLWP